MDLISCWILRMVMSSPREVLMLVKIPTRLLLQMVQLLLLTSTLAQTVFSSFIPSRSGMERILQIWEFSSRLLFYRYRLHCANIFNLKSELQNNSNWLSYEKSLKNQAIFINLCSSGERKVHNWSYFCCWAMAKVQRTSWEYFKQSSHHRHQLRERWDEQGEEPGDRSLWWCPRGCQAVQRFRLYSVFVFTAIQMQNIFTIFSS